MRRNPERLVSIPRAVPGRSSLPSTVQVLYFEGCPGGAASEKMLREALPKFEVEMTEFPLSEFRKLNTPGSPTLLLNGQDLFPTQDTIAGASCCRLYKTPQGLRSYPTTSMVQQALKARAFTNQPPTPSDSTQPL